MTKIAKTISMGFYRIFGYDDTDGLVRLFEIEYNREYRNLRKNGVEISPELIRSYLALSK